MKKNIQELANKGLINRFNKIICNDRMDEWTANAMIDMLHDWKNSYTERALAHLDEQIAKMQEMRQITIKKLEEEKKARK